MENSQQLTINIIMIIAVLLGPILALVISWFRDEQHFKKLRQFEIFRTLMKYRNSRKELGEEYVCALNLIEIEFNKNKEVIESRKKLQECFNHMYAFSESLKAQDFYFDQAKILKAQLISEIAKVLKIKIDGISVLHGSYAPGHWNDQETMKESLDSALHNVLTGKKPIKVSTDIDNTSNNTDVENEEN